METASVKVDEYLEKNEVECKIELEDYNTFIYVNEGSPNTPPKQENKATNQQQDENSDLQ